MNPLPVLDDEAAMILRGRLSTLGRERAVTTSSLGDAMSALSGCSWEQVDERCAAVLEKANRLRALARLWQETTSTDAA